MTTTPDDVAAQQVADEQTHGAMNELPLLEFLAAAREYHHTAIWEEQKHFTWMISLLFSLQALVLTSNGLDDIDRFVVVLASSLVGFLLAFTALRTQRREGEYFSFANAAYVRAYNTVFGQPHIATPSATANRPISSLPLAVVRGRCGVRDYFQFMFLCFATIFVLTALIASVGAAA